MNNPLHWSREAETNLSLRRMSGDRDAKAPAFWPGRPGLYHGECPLVADGELLTIAHRAGYTISEAQAELHEALTSKHDDTDSNLQTAQDCLRKAIAQIETLRQRIVGAGEVLEAIEREAQS